MSIDQQTKIELCEGVYLEALPGSDRLRVTSGNKIGYVEFKELYGIVFMLADPDRQDQLLPVRHTEMTTFTKVHMVKAKKDLKKGDVIKVRCHTNVETAIVDGLKGIVEKPKSTILH